MAAGNASLQTSVAEGRADSLLSQQRFKAALQLAQRTIAADGSMEADSKRSFQQDEVIAESHLGMKSRHLPGFRPMLPLIRRKTIRLTLRMTS